MHLYNIDCIVGARPNFIKIAPIMRALSGRNGMSPRLIHTGQHYDVAMNAVFFEELAIPSPDVNLEVGSGTHTEQTARIMSALEPVFVARCPHLVLVVGDVNSTMAASLVASKLNIPIAHVEAGLRSFDRTMPEEINRIVTDRLSDLLFASEPSAVDNLVNEGVAIGQIHLVGNVMIDSLYACLDRAVPPHATLAKMGASTQFLEAATEQGFGLVTLHRPSNVDDPVKLEALLRALNSISHDLCLIFPVHPRTRAVISAAGLNDLLGSATFVTPPLSYLQVLGLMRGARLAITDSGGVQEETTALGVPCLTVRENTERPITVQEGTNTIVGSSPDDLIAAAAHILRSGARKGRIPALWDGKAASRIAHHIEAFLRAKKAPQLGS